MLLELSKLTAVEWANPTLKNFRSMIRIYSPSFAFVDDDLAGRVPF
jgi:hypothetical protein